MRSAASRQRVQGSRCDGRSPPGSGGSDAGGIVPGPHLLKILGVGITEVEFTTYTEDPTVEFKEIEVRIRADRTTSDGAPVTFTSTQSIHMRN